MQKAVEHFNAGELLQAESLCQGLLAADPTHPDALRMHEQIWMRMDHAMRGAVHAFQENPDTVAVGNLSRLRMDMVSFLRLQPAGSLIALWACPFKAGYLILLKSGIRNFLRNPAEDALVEELRAKFAARNGPEEITTILAAMLLCHNHELPVPRGLIAVPEWLRDDYLDFLLEIPEGYNSPGEADAYSDYLARLIDTIHELGFSRHGISDDPAVRRVLFRVSGKIIMLQSYFTTRYQRDSFAKRADIISASLMIMGMKTLLAIPPKLSASDKIRLGIYACPFGLSTETFFTFAHFEHLDRTRYEIILYTDKSTDQDIERNCIAYADRFVVLPTEFKGIVNRMREDNLDILLISTNMAAISSTAVLLGSSRIAPIQVATISSMTTTGCRHADVLLSAEWNEPGPDAPDHYSEYLCKIPGSINYYRSQPVREPATVDLDRAKLQIAPGQIVFFSGAVCYKILPELSRLWMEILAAVPNSILLLMPFNSSWKQPYRTAPFLARIHRQMTARELPLNRLRVVNNVPTRADVHRLTGLADIYLDAYPFSDACSILDPIMAGVPMLARQCPIGLSNHAASLLRMVGLGELVTHSDEDYLASAAALARDPVRRGRIRDHLLALKAEKLPRYFDLRQFSARVGNALEALYHRYEDRFCKVERMSDQDLKDAIQALSDSLVGKNFELNNLTDVGIVECLILPFFRVCRPQGRTPHMVDVGACHGVLTIPFLFQGWTADVFEPDPSARQILQNNLSGFGTQCRVHPVAISNSSAEKVSFHKSATHGLSGLDDSPFGTTESTIEVPLERLADFYARQGIGAVDFLKIDAEGYDFDALESHDFALMQPRLILIEFGTHFPRQTLTIINQAIERMRGVGYGAITFNYTDDGNFQKGDFIYRLIDIFVDHTIPAERSAAFGNIIFYRADDRIFLHTLYALLESCRQPRRATWDESFGATVNLGHQD